MVNYHDRYTRSCVENIQGVEMKATTKEREEMKRTQPKKCRVVDGLTGKARMVIVELSEVEKERLAANE
jgi:RNase P subunit RPR2